MKKTMGPFESKKSAMRYICQVDMRGEFANGLVLTIDGEMVMSTGCKASRDADGQWFADVTIRPVTDVERKAILTARIKKQIKDLDAMIRFDGPDHPKRAQRIAERAALEAQVAFWK